MPTPIYDELTEENEFDPLEGIEWEELHTMGQREPVARVQVSRPSIHDLPRYKARYDRACNWWQVDKLHYLTEFVASYQPQRIFRTEAEATEWADTMNRGE